MKIFAAREQDAHEGWVWLYKPELPQRCVIKITNLANTKIIYCEALQIDENFLKQYNQEPRYFINTRNDTIVMSEWYRAGLGGISTNSDVELSIKPCQSFIGQYQASIHHPQTVVRLAARLGALGLILGLLSFSNIGSLWELVKLAIVRG